MNRRTAILLGCMLALLGLVTLWCYQEMASSRDAALAARNGLKNCKAIAAKIRSFDDRPAMAAAHEKLATETTSLIEKAAKTAQILPNSLVRISPSDPQRLADSVYKEKPTHVQLKRVTIAQLVRLMHSLLNDDTSLNTKKIRLTTSNREDTGKLWNAELTFTYLIYDPPKK